MQVHERPPLVPLRRESGSAQGPRELHRPDDSPSIGQLIRELTQDVNDLMAQHVALARTELSAAVDNLKSAAIALSAGVVVTLAGGLVLLAAATLALAERFEPWVAALIVGGATVLVGLILLAVGKRKASASHIAPQRTMRAIEEDMERSRRTL
jgi:hypothetical protein